MGGAGLDFSWRLRHDTVLFGRHERRRISCATFSFRLSFCSMLELRDMPRTTPDSWVSTLPGRQFQPRRRRSEASTVLGNQLPGSPERSVESTVLGNRLRQLFPSRLHPRPPPRTRPLLPLL